MRKLLISSAALLLLAACDSSKKKCHVGADGSVGAFEAGSAADFVHNAGDRVYFDYNKHHLSHDATTALDRQAAWLMNYPHVNVTVEGHCDERGTEKYNMILGEKRAKAVKDYAAALGVHADRLNTISYGKSKPQVIGNTEEAYARNRVAITVVH